MVASYYKAAGALPSSAMITSMARRALTHDRILKLAEADFRVEAGGDVIVVTPEMQKHVIAQSDIRMVEPRSTAEGAWKKEPIVVPRQEAYERIAQAALLKAKQLEQGYERCRRLSRRWLTLTLAGVMSAIAGSLAMGLLVVLPGAISGHLPMLSSLFVIDACCVVAICLIVRRFVTLSRRADSYFNDWLQLKDYYEVLRTIAEIDIDEQARKTLQEIMLARSLGVFQDEQQKVI